MIHGITRRASSHAHGDESLGNGAAVNDIDGNGGENPMATAHYVQAKAETA